ncbi:MAG: 50S ribosomal protein L21 [Nitrospinae bacterium]|nr:50S ribosomal protein L21 [Nitrospinota bacterium]
MFAVFQTGGKQYRVVPGDEVNIEKIPGNVGETVKFDRVLAVGQDESVEIGVPIVQGMAVTGEILRQAKAKKIIVFKFKRRKKYRKRQGHRQEYTRLKITEIGKAS